MQRKRIKVENDIAALAKTLKSIQAVYPFVLEKESEPLDAESEAQAMPFDHDIEISTFVLIR